MTAVKGSKQYRLTVVPHRPVFRGVLLVLVVLSITAAAGLGFYVGRSGHTGVSFVGQQAQLQTLQQAYEVKVAEADDLRQQVANLRLGAEVDRQANDEVRNQVVVLKERIADQEETISFYKALMSPGGNHKGLAFGSVSITPQGDDRGYDFKVVIQQLNSSEKQLRGYLQFTVVGRKDGKVSTMPLSSLTNDITDKNIPLKFKYFQTLSGHLTLPEGFLAERVDLLVQPAESGAAKIEKHIDWPSQETQH